MNGKLILTCLLGVALLAAPTSVMAQYKNASFGFDTAGWLLSIPSSLDDDGNVLPVDNRPMRFQVGLRVGGETNWKLNHDSWWFTGRVNLAFMTYPSGDPNGTTQEQYDAHASSTVGTALGVEAGIGVRYFFLTDRIRPYFQIGTSFMRLFTLSTLADEICSGSSCDPRGYSNAENFFTHPNVGALHLQPGLEWVFARDMALHIYADGQYWLIFNADDNISLAVGMGINFYL